jgi:hypothetical protein
MSILHTSTIFNLPKIIKDGYLLPKYPDDENVSTKGVYGVYVFRDMNYNGKYWYYGSNIAYTYHVIFVIKPSALKDLRFAACPSISYGNCLLSAPEAIIISNGIKTHNNTSNKSTNITKFIPKDINRLETFINTKLTEKEDANAKNTKQKKLNMWDALTHEVVFLEPIPLHYIDAIIVAPSMVKRVTEYIEKVNEKRKAKRENTAGKKHTLPSCLNYYTPNGCRIMDKRVTGECKRILDSTVQLKVLRRPTETTWKTVLFNQ